MSIAAHHDAPECPACSAPCGTKNGESIAPGDLRCASCGDDWAATDAELAKAGAADASWETEQRRQDIMKHERPTETAALQLKLLALVFALAWSMIACTPIQGRTARDIGAGAAGLTCAVAGAAEGQPWAGVVATVGCALERLLERRGTMEAAPVAQIPLLEALTELGHAYDRATRTGLEADADAAEAARVEADRLAVEYWGPR